MESNEPMTSQVHIVLASDENYRPGLEVTRASILRSCRTPERLVWHAFDERALEGVVGADLPAWNTSRMPYLRLWLPEILKDVDWIVYADVDTVWNRDVCELWDGVVPSAERAGDGEAGKSIYWVRDFLSTRDCAREWIARVSRSEGIAFDWTRYACSGVCVMNLRKLRETGFTRRVQELFAKQGVPKYPDQDVLNVLLNRDCGLLPSVWDTLGDCSNLPRADEECVYHLTGVGRHFHDAVPPTYPPQYQYWWNVRELEVRVGVGGVVGVGGGGGQTVLFSWRMTGRSRLLAALWPLHPLARLLPLRLRERIVRQWFFARVLVDGARNED